MKRYNLLVSEDQARLIQATLDFWARMACGQLEEILRHPGIPSTHSDEDRRDQARRGLFLLRGALFPDLTANAYHGLLSPRLPDEVRVAYDLVQVIRNQISVDRALSFLETPKQMSGQSLAEMKEAA